MAYGLFGLIGYILPIIGALVVAIMMIIHRRGGARAMGILGAVLVVVGIIYPPISILLGFGAGSLTAAEAMAGQENSWALDFFGSAAPGVLIGAGVVLICAAAVSGVRGRAGHRR